jgi:hypothetical protein
LILFIRSLIVQVQVIEFRPDFLQVRRGVDHRRLRIIVASELREGGERHFLGRLIEKRMTEDVRMHRSFFKSAAVIQPAHDVLDVPDTDALPSVRDKQGGVVIRPFAQVFQ